MNKRFKLDRITSGKISATLRLAERLRFMLVSLTSEMYDTNVLPTTRRNFTNTASVE